MESDAAGRTQSITFDLPIDSYVQIECLAAALGVSVEKAAALTIFAGQRAQRALDENFDKRNQRKTNTNAI